MLFMLDPRGRGGLPPYAALFAPAFGFADTMSCPQHIFNSSDVSCMLMDVQCAKWDETDRSLDVRKELMGKGPLSACAQCLCVGHCPAAVPALAYQPCAPHSPSHLSQPYRWTGLQSQQLPCHRTPGLGSSCTTLGIRQPPCMHGTGEPCHSMQCLRHDSYTQAQCLELTRQALVEQALHLRLTPQARLRLLC